MKIYAYVKKQCCTTIDAQRSGALLGRNLEPVAKHGDYERWLYGKRQTLLIANTDVNDSNQMYRRQCARAVARLLDWMD